MKKLFSLKTICSGFLGLWNIGKPRKRCVTFQNGLGEGREVGVGWGRGNSFLLGPRLS